MAECWPNSQFCYQLVLVSEMAEKINIRKLKAANINGRIDTTSFDAANNTVNVVFATENPVLETMPDGERFYEQLAVTTAAADLVRFNNNAAVLDNHRTESVKNQLGRVERAWIDNATNEGCATLKLSDSEDWKGVVNDISKGIITNISFTFRRKKMVDTGLEKDGIRILKTTEWEGLEISFVTIPADVNAGTRSHTDEYEVQIFNQNKSTAMTEEEKKARKLAIQTACRKLKLSDEFANNLIADEAITVDAARALALDEFGKDEPAPTPVDLKSLQGKERQRALTIIEVCRKLNIAEDKNKDGVLFSTELIGKDITVDAARALAIDRAAELQNLQIDGVNPTITMNADNVAKRAQARENVILERLGITKDEYGKKLETAGYRGMSLIELATESAIDCGIINPNDVSRRSLNALYNDKNFKMSIMGQGSRSSSGLLTTSDFPALMENVLNKMLRNSYTLAEKSWDVFTKKTTANDFKPMSRVSLHDVFIDPDKDVVNEGGEYTLIKMTDSAEKYSIRKWGKKVPFAWESIINDDLSGLDRTTASIIAGFTQAQNRMVYRTLTSATALNDGSNRMYDGKVLFHADHNNLISSGTAITLADLQNMRTKLRQQKAPNGNLLNLRGRYLVVGPTLETLAEQFTSANFTPNQSGVINKFGPTLTPVVDANITDNSWYIIADPGIIDTIEVASLGGQDMYAESRYSFDVDGIETKIRMTFGLKAIDYRGMVKNPGT